MPFRVVIPAFEWSVRPHEPGEPARHVAELSESAGFARTRANRLALRARCGGAGFSTIAAHEGAIPAWTHRCGETGVSHGRSVQVSGRLPWKRSVPAAWRWAARCAMQRVPATVAFDE